MLRCDRRAIEVIDEGVRLEDDKHITGTCQVVVTENSADERLVGASAVGECRLATARPTPGSFMTSSVTAASTSAWETPASLMASRFK